MSAFTNFCTRHSFLFGGAGCPFCIAEGEPTGSVPRTNIPPIPERDGGETREQTYGVVGEPFAADHLVIGRSTETVCGKKIGTNWLIARGIFTAKSFVGLPGACQECSRIVRPSARDGETLSDATKLAEKVVEMILGACDEHGPIAPRYAVRLVTPILLDALYQRPENEHG